DLPALSEKFRVVGGRVANPAFWNPAGLATGPTTSGDPLGASDERPALARCPRSRSRDRLQKAVTGRGGRSPVDPHRETGRPAQGLLKGLRGRGTEGRPRGGSGGHGGPGARGPLPGPPHGGAA